MGSVSVCSINCLPDDLLVQILSFLPTKQAALTSLLSKRWRTLFAFTHNLDFDNSIFLYPNKPYRYGPDRADIQKRFSDFVDRTLALQDGNKIKKFSLTLSRTYRDEHHDFDRWICYALEHGVSELHLHITATLWKFAIPSKVSTSTTLVKLSLGRKHYIRSLPSDTSLPTLKVLFLDSIGFEGDQLFELLAACPVLEDLTIQYYNYFQEISYVISSKTIKKLSVTYKCHDDYYDDFSNIISFDTPNVVDFYFSDYLRSEFPKCHLDSVAKATLDLHHWRPVQNGADVTNLISGIRNVKILHLTSSAVEVISVCCYGGLPVFNKLTDLVFSSNKQGFRVFLPLLLERSPKLKTLVLSGLHRYTIKRRHRFVGIQIPVNNQIKMMRIMKYQGSAHELIHISHFLLKMECLEVLKVYVAPTMDDPKKMQLTKDMLKLPTASSNLKIQVM